MHLQRSSLKVLYDTIAGAFLSQNIYRANSNGEILYYEEEE